MVTIDGEPWFVAADVCRALGLEMDRKGVNKHLTGLDVDQRRVVADHTSEHQRITVSVRDGKRGNPNRTFLTEGGLYALIFGSKMPFAQAFKSWVTDVVLPAIRKDGAYIIGEEKVATGENISGVTRFPGKLSLYSSRNAGEAPCLFETQTQESWSPSTTPSRI